MMRCNPRCGVQLKNSSGTGCHETAAAAAGRCGTKALEPTAPPPRAGAGLHGRGGAGPRFARISKPTCRSAMTLLMLFRLASGCGGSLLLMMRGSAFCWRFAGRTESCAARSTTAVCSQPGSFKSSNSFGSPLRKSFDTRYPVTRRVPHRPSQGQHLPALLAALRVAPA